MKKIILTILFAVVLMIMAASGVAAVSETTLKSDSFICDTLFAENANIYAFEDGTASVVFQTGAPTVLVEDIDAEKLRKSNALRIVMANNSGCNQVQITYTYHSEDGAVEVVETETLTIERRSGKRSYYVYPSHIERIDEIRLVFSGGYNGSLQFFAVEAVSVYNDSQEQAGLISDCVYDKERGVVRIGGTVNHEIASGTRDATVEVYAFSMDETVTSRKVSSTAPLATMPLSMRFEFEIPLNFFSDRFLQYVVVIMSPEGRVLHMYTPQYPCSPRDEGDESFLKGVYTDKSTLAVRADSGMAVIDVYLDRMQSEGNNGLLHVIDGRYYYIDREYIYRLDDLVKRYENDGCKVYFRLLLSGGSGYHVLHNGNMEPKETAYRGLYISGETSRFMLFAYTQFLCNRYGDGGALSGLVVGRSVDASLEYNYVGTPSLERYTSIYATSLYLIAEAAHANGRNIDVVVPVTGRFGENSTQVDNQGNYSPELFLTSLCKLVQAQYGRSLTFRIMVEDSYIPEILSPDSGTTDIISDFEDILEELIEVYGRVEDQYLYYWMPQGESSEIVGYAYTYLYYRCFFSDVLAFVLSTEALEDDLDWEGLFETVKYIDTYKGIGRSTDALKAMGADQWNSLVSGFDRAALPKRNTYIYGTYSAPALVVQGSYTMWDYQQGRSVYDWSLGAEGSLAVADVDFVGRALVASLVPNKAQAGYSEIIYAYSADEIMSVVDMLSVDLVVLGEPDTTYKLILEICGTGALAEVTAHVKSGVRTTVYLNTLELGRNEHIRNIRIFSAPEEGQAPYELCIERLTAYSTSLNDEALEEAVKEAKLASMSKNESRGQDENLSTTLKILLPILMVIISTIILTALVRRSDEA